MCRVEQITELCVQPTTLKYWNESATWYKVMQRIRLLCHNGEDKLRKYMKFSKPMREWHHDKIMSSRPHPYHFVQGFSAGSRNLAIQSNTYISTFLCTTRLIPICKSMSSTRRSFHHWCSNWIPFNSSQWDETTTRNENLFLQRTIKPMGHWWLLRYYYYSSGFVWEEEASSSSSKRITGRERR